MDIEPAVTSLRRTGLLQPVWSVLEKQVSFSTLETLRRQLLAVLGTASVQLHQLGGNNS